LPLVLDDGVTVVDIPADVARAVGSSLRLAEVMQLSLRHVVALLRGQGATLGLLRDGQLIMVAGIGAGEVFDGDAR
jgi:flagellar motor switch/type III secretory pathway protein FliN